MAGYDLAMLFWRLITHIFFREVRARGAFNIPKADDGPVIFVGAPHNNQFLDLNLGLEVYRETGRRVRFLVAAHSMRRKVIGEFARMFECIPVERAGDNMKPGIGQISTSPTDPTLILGHNTQFTTQLSVKAQITLPNHKASVEVVEIKDDTHLVVKKPFPTTINSTTPSPFKVVPVVDQGAMYKHVYQCLQKGGSIGIFPEGGSHDRTDLLPLKAGVAIMALGAMVNDPECKVKIVPVGLSYFHAHRFRSRAVVEFGRAFDVPAELVSQFKQGGPQKREAVSKFLDVIYDSLKTVTVRAPDYDTLMVVQAARRLYKTPGQHLTLGQVVELNRRLVDGYLHFKDQPRMVQLREDVVRYNRLLTDLGLRDHQVPRAIKSPFKTFSLLFYRLTLLSVWAGLALPGTLLNGPIFILASVISRRKAKEALAASSVKLKGNDVLATWKILIALVVTPILYTLYALVALWISIKSGAPYKYRIATPFIVATILPIMNFAALKFGEAGVDVLKSLRPLIISLFFPFQQKQFDKIKQMRERLSNEVADVINEFGPRIYEDFDERRIMVPSSSSASSSSVSSSSAFLGSSESNNNANGSGGGGVGTGASAGWAMRSRHSSIGNVDAQGLGLSHPMTWLDERLFGWSSSSYSSSYSSAASSSSSSVYGDTTPPTNREDGDDDDYGDYESVLRVIREANGGGGGGGNTPLNDGGNSRQGSYADLQRLKMTSSSSAATTTTKRKSSHSPIGGRKRKPSLSDLIDVRDIGDVIEKDKDLVEGFGEATRELNLEYEEVRRRKGKGRDV